MTSNPSSLCAYRDGGCTRHWGLWTSWLSSSRSIRTTFTGGRLRGPRAVDEWSRLPEPVKNSRDSLRARLFAAFSECGRHLVPKFDGHWLNSGLAVPGCLDMRRTLSVEDGGDYGERDLSHQAERAGRRLGRRGRVARRSSRSRRCFWSAPSRSRARGPSLRGTRHLGRPEQSHAIFHTRAQPRRGEPPGYAVPLK